jgi:peptide-methionine (R)-S-oxide reductase
MGEKINKADSEWKKQLTPEEYHMAREKGTEKAFTGRYWDFHGKGMYKCVCCGADLFDSETKFESGSGWPSFFKPASDERIEEERDSTFGMIRTEVKCSKCGAHLGHLFGPKPTGLRYCINSASLKFEEKK